MANNEGHLRLWPPPNGAMLPSLVRLVGLGGLALLGIGLYRAILGLGGDPSSQPWRLGWLLVGVTLLGMAGFAFVLTTQPPTGRGWRFAEWSLLIGGGLLWRGVLFGSPPTFSPDVYRYLWDAHLLLHGVSPYLHGPDYPGFVGLRDAVVWPAISFRDAPTIYPPAAQLIFVLAGIVAPLKLNALKVLIELADTSSALLLMVLLRRQGADPRRFLLYWWSPLPIIEFALNAHVDALAMSWTLLAVLMAAQTWRGARAVAGVALAMAALTKIYPLIFVIALVRRRDRAFIVALGATLVLAYLPLLPLGIGGGGFLSTYFQQRFVDQGIAQYFLGLGVTSLGGSSWLLTALQFGCIGALCLGVLWWRWHFGLNPITAILALWVIWMCFAPHIFPWYVTALLPFIALAWDGSASVEARAGNPWPPAPVLALWLFALLMPFTYIIFAPGGDAGLFHWFFAIPLLVALAPLRHAATRAVWRERWRRFIGSFPTLPTAFTPRGDR